MLHKLLIFCLHRYSLQEVMTLHLRVFKSYVSNKGAVDKSDSVIRSERVSQETDSCKHVKQDGLLYA